MISSAFNTLLYEPFYNALVFLAGIIPGGDIGLAVIILTVVVRVVLTPLAHKQMHTQKRMKSLEGEMAAIKKQYQSDKQEQTRRVMELYKQHGINPFSGFLLVLIQIPILLALYFVFTRGLPFSQEDLYEFIKLPTAVNFNLLGLVDLSEKSIIMAVLVGASQFLQIRLSLPPVAKDPVATGGKSFGEELAKSMNTNMRYVMPVIIAVVAGSFPSVVALYWLTTNIYSIGHELLVRRLAKATVSPVKS